MTNKTRFTWFLHFCVVAALGTFLSPASAAELGTAASEDLEVSAAPAAADAGPPATAAPPASTVAPAPSAAPGAPATATVLASPTVQATPQPNAAATGVPSRAAAVSASPTSTMPEPVSPPANVTPAANQGPLPVSSEAKLVQQLTEGYRVSGYFQAQYENHQDSEDQLNQDNQLLNKNRFVLRRGRIRIARDWDYAALLLEFDGNTVNGPTLGVQKAEVSLVYGRSPEKDVYPLVQFTMGIFDLPFGYEITESPKTRPFMERSTGGRALWPSEPDAGARLSGQLKFLRYALALSNGEPLGEKSGLGLQDPNNNKDVTVRLGAITNPWQKVTVSGDVSYNAGKGFHAGTPATKSTITWQDLNHDGVVQPNELVGNPASAATPSMNFARWAIGADAQLTAETPIGKSMLYGEIVIAENLDRGLFIADPIATGSQNIRELNYYIAFIQEVTPYGLVGFRTDYYNPNADFLDQRAGQLIPTSQAIRDYSPLVGLVLPDQAKLLLEWDIQSNLMGRDSRGVPARYPDNIWTLRLQVNL